MNKAKFVFLTILAISISVILVVLQKTSNVYYGAHEVYRVYLAGNSIGVIDSKEQLEAYIDKEQASIKEKYNVDRVYTPEGLKIVEEITHNEKTKKVKDIYEEIKENEDFTINGYIVTIYNENDNSTAETADDEVTKPEKEYIYLLSKDIFAEAVNNTIRLFLDEEKYDAYLAENQQEIVDTGKLIENVYIKERITIKKGLIPASETIFSTTPELSKYLLFGTTETQNKYTVNEGDTISSIAAANTLSVDEFLIANTDLSGKEALLFPGQEVVTNLINPKITVVEETHEVELQDIKFKTETTEDSSLYVGYSVVLQSGENGQSIVTQKIKKENGQITNAYIVSSNVIKEAIPRIVTVGARTQYIIANTEFWAWPTVTPYMISDYYGPRWGRMHNGIDITGTGYGSPIYAANSGTVKAIATGYGNNLYSGGMATFGNYIDVNHNNGYITRYAHLKDVYVREGEAVSMGQLIGTMGNSGYSTGTHLHFEVMYNDQYINPFSLYQ